MSEEGLVQRGYRITGRVQGVFYRAWTRETALELGVKGTVRNRFDGSVEARALGSPETMKAFEARLWEGPPAARVDAVEAFESADPLPSASFEILPSA